MHPHKLSQAVVSVIGMSKALKEVHVCSGCGHSSPRWFGKCPDCGGWNTAFESGSAAAAAVLQPRPLSVVGAGPSRISTGISEVDRVLGGGLVPGGVVLLAGEPGIGKSTLVLQLISGFASNGSSALLVTGEESLEQVALRASRLQIDTDRFLAAAGTDLHGILAALETERPGLLVIDSVQTLEDPELEQVPGSVTQVRGCTASLVRYAKATGTAVILVGHVTKEGSVAGPKTLEHVVDVVLHLDGERSGAMRLLRGSKNRFGSCEETGVFTMCQRGLETVEDPSALLLADRCAGIFGSIVFPGLEGTRPMLVEIQALTSTNDAKFPRRVHDGVDARRLALMIAVLEKRANTKLSNEDVFVTTAGGLAVDEPAVDLPLALAVLSARQGRELPQEAVAFGEVGLGGEVRRVPGAERRLAEASRLGFTTAIVPRGVEGGRGSMKVVPVSSVAEAAHRLLGA